MSNDTPYTATGKSGEFPSRVTFQTAWSPFQLIGSFSNDDGDGNENNGKAIGLDKQNNNSTRASRFFVHFFAVPTRKWRENT